MEVQVYADLLFLINTGMDGLCLILTGRLLHRKTALWRVLLSAAVGGIYAVLSLFPTMSHPISLLLDLGVCFLMCAIVFCGRNTGGIRRYLLSVLIFFLLSMALGGVMTALYSLWNRLGFTELLPKEKEGLGTWLFTVLALLGGSITLWGGRLFRRTASVRECTVTVELNGRTASLQGLVDTGNLLRDPMGGRPVICVRQDKLNTILSETLRCALEDPTSMTALTGLQDPKDVRRIRLIPASTATGGQLMAGILPDRVLLSYTSNQKQHDKEADVVLGLSRNLTHSEALVPAELLNL